MVKIKILIGKENGDFILKCFGAAKQFDYDVRLCSHEGKLLLTEIKSFKPDFVVCSAFMADGSAAELIKRIKGIGKEPFFIVTSSYKNFDTEKEIMAFLNAYFILEPFEPSAFLDSIQRMSADNT